MRRKTISHSIKTLFSISLIALLAACSNGDSDEAVKSPDLPPGELQSITVDCVPGIMSIGSMGQCTAIGRFREVKETSDDVFEVVVTNRDITNLVAWRSIDSGVVTVNQTGKTTAVAAGTTDIVATLDGVSGRDTITVPAATLQSISVNCSPNTILVGGTSNCTATGVFDDGISAPQSRNITTQVTWSSVPTSIATVNQNGVVTGVSQGNATITATSGSLSDSDTVTVRVLNVTALDVTPETATIPPLCTLQYQAIATFDDGSTADVTASANIVWSSSVAATTVDSAGFATAGPQGTATTTITATYTDAAGNSESDTASLSVEDTGIASLCVEAAENADPTVATCNVVDPFNKPAGITVPFLAKLVYDSGSFCPLFANDPRVTWASTDEDTATVDNNGVASTLDDGETDIVATMSIVPISGSHPLTVGVGVPNPLVEYEVLPDVSCVGRYNLVDGLQESDNLPGEQQMLAEGVFQISGPTCDFADHTTCTGSLNAQTEWSSSEGFWDGSTCTSTIPAGSIPGTAAPGHVDADGVVRPSAFNTDGGQTVRLGTTCVTGRYTGSLLVAGASDIDGGTVLVLPVTNDVLVDDAAELCDALSPLLLVGGENGGAGFPLQVVSAVAQILNPALTAAFNDGAIPIDSILEQVLTPLSDEATSQLVGPGGPLEVLIDGLDTVYGGLNCAVGGILDALLGGGDPGAIAACGP